METEKREAYVDQKDTWHCSKCGGTDSECVCDSDDRGAVSSSGNDGERVKETITRFSTTSQEYYAEGEAYSQTSDRVHTYSVEETR